MITYEKVLSAGFISFREQGKPNSSWGQEGMDALEAEHADTGVVYEIIEIFDTPFSDRQATAMAEVDLSAERARAKFITPGAGQAMVYRQKQEEARTYLADPATPAAELPLLYARAARKIVDPSVVAAEWQAQAAAWLTIAAAIEDEREAAKEAITAAVDQAGIDAVLTTLNWPAPV